MALGASPPAAHAAVATSGPTMFNVSYGTSPFQRMDIYPIVGGKPAPAVIVVHGGGWITGGKSLLKVRTAAESLAAKGFVVFNINYRLATDTQAGIPMQTDDLTSVVRWIADRGAQYGADPSRISFLGGSAGGHLAALTALLLNAQAPGTVRSVVTLSGPMDFVQMAAEQLAGPEEELKMGLPNYLGCRIIDCTVEQLAAPSPINHVSSTSPPFLMANSDAEVISLTQAQHMNDTLVSAGSGSTLRVFPGDAHGFGLFGPEEADIARFLGSDISPPTISGTPPPGTVGAPYSFGFATTNTLTTTLESGTLPAGVTLSTRGRLTGTPAESGDFEFTARATGYFGTADTIATLHVDPQPLISVDDVTITEGDSGSTPATFAVSLDLPSALTVTVDYATNDVTATAGTDYDAVAGTLTFAPGTTSQTVPVAVLGDLTFEPDETFGLELTNAVDAVLADPSGTATIAADNDVPLLAVNDVSTVEGDAETAAVEFTVSLDTAAPAEVTVGYRTVDGTATAPDDFIQAEGNLTFPPGTTSLPLPVDVVGDTAVEPDEDFTVELFDATGAGLSDTTGTATILNGSDLPLVFVQDVSLVEGDSDSTPAIFTLSLDGPSTQDVTVDYTTADATAAAGSDYEALAGTAVIPAGTTSLDLSVAVSGDLTAEPDETFTLELTGTTHAELADSSGVATILNGADVPLLVVDDVSAVEGDAGRTTLEFTVALDVSTDADVTVEFATADGTASDAGDYLATTGSVTVPAGATAVPVAVEVVGDLVVEADETFSLQLSNPVGAAVATGTGTGTILDDSDLGTLLVDDLAVVEGDSGSAPAAFTVALEAPAEVDVTVEYATADGTATAGEDYLAATGTVTFAPGTTAQTVVVDVLGDLAVEPDETFTLELASPTRAVLTDSRGTATVRTEPDLPSLSIDDLVVDEGDNTRDNAVFTVSLDVPFDAEVTVEYRTADVTATAGSDYDETSGTVTFAPGSTRQSLSVPISGDVRAEPDETFTLALDAPVNALLADATATATILAGLDLPQLRVADLAVVEGDEGSVAAELSIALDTPADVDVTVGFTTADGTATAGSDYTAASGTVTFPAGSMSQLLTLDVLGDTALEPAETFTVALADATGAVLSDASADVTILNGSDVPVLSVGNVSAVEGDAGVSVSALTVSLDSASAEDVTVAFATADGTATAGTDYASTSGELTIPAGSTSAPIPVDVFGDATVEPDETFVVQLFAPVGALLGDPSGAVTIVNDPDLSTVTTVSPAVLGQGAMGKPLTVSGKNFLPSTAVSFADPTVVVVSSTFVDASTITVVVNVAAATTIGPAAVIVTNAGLGTTTCAGCLQVTARPRVTGPALVAATGVTGLPLRLTGTGFQAGATVRLTGHAGVTATVTTVTAGRLDVAITVSKTAYVGTYNVVVTNPDGGTSSCTNCFVVVPAPTVTGMTPAAVVRGGTVAVVVSGSGFVPGAQLTPLTGMTFTDVVVLDSSHIRATLTVSSRRTPAVNLPVTVVNPASAGSGSGTCTCLTILA